MNSNPSRRLRIAYVVHDYDHISGHSRYVAELANRFKQDHDVHIFANTFEEPNPAGLTYHHVPASRVNVMASLLTFLVPATYMVRGNYDIIHAQGFCGLRQNVVTAHICQEAWIAAFDKYTGPQGWRKRLFHSVARRLDKLSFRNGAAERFIAVSRRVQDDLAVHYGCTRGVRIIHHGVDTEVFHPRNRSTWRKVIREQIGLTDETLTALYVGDLQKAFPAAVRGVARVAGLHLVAVSRSPVEPYRELIVREGVTERVHLVPPTGNVERYYAAADLFVFPSFYDSFGLVVTEAMASGLPVVCSRAAGVSELIDDGVDGILVNDGWDPVQLAAAVQPLAGDASLRERLGSAARCKAEQHTWDEVARQTMAVYREVAGTKSNSEPEA
jgi:UDP-glucose:(heptosyl)LPS alpha-1,3-glucosyltransferase